MATRAFPIGNAGAVIRLPINADGTPKRDSKAWKTMIANAAGKKPEDRSPAERAALAKESGQENADLSRLQSAYALGERAAAEGNTTNPFTTPQFKAMWEAGRTAALRYQS